VPGEAPQAAPPRTEELELTAPPGESEPQAPPKVVIPRWVQLVMLPISVLALYVVARAASKALVIFIVAGLIALILNPLVALVQKHARLPRGLAVLTVYLGFFLVLAGIGLLLANPISNQVESFSHSVPRLIKEGNTSLAELQSWLHSHGIHVQFIKQGHTALQTLGEKVIKGSSSVVTFGGGLLTELVKAGFDLILVFVASVYMLVYGERIGRLVRRIMPAGDGTPGDDYPTLVQRSVGRYVGGQLAFSIVMGATAALGLYLFGVLGIFPDGKKYAVVFGIFYGLAELIPYVGPIIGAIPAVLVALFTDPITALWVALLFVGLQQIEGHFVAPQIFGHTLRINPLLVIFALLFGLQVHGVVGALIALPILAVLRETVIYLSRHVTFESWNGSGRGLL
jgi:predicted PurR-regulated permease PerM